MDNRKRVDHPGSPHFEDPGASYKQKIRLSAQINPPSSPVAGGKRRRLNPAAKADPKRRRLSSPGSGPGPLSKKTRTTKPRAKDAGKGRGGKSSGGSKGAEKGSKAKRP